MAIERYTESLTLNEMKCTIGKNSFGYVFPQGDVSDVDKIEKIVTIQNPPLFKDEIRMT